MGLVVRGQRRTEMPTSMEVIREEQALAGMVGGEWWPMGVVGII